MNNFPIGLLAAVYVGRLVGLVGIVGLGWVELVRLKFELIK